MKAVLYCLNEKLLRGLKLQFDDTLGAVLTIFSVDALLDL